MVVGDFYIKDGEEIYAELNGRIDSLEELVDDLASENEMLNAKLEIYEKYFNASLGIDE